jgi:hypothetical protein
MRTIPIISQILEDRASPNMDRPDTRGPGTALDHLGLEHDLDVFRLPVLRTVRQNFLHPMFVDQKFARRHRIRFLLSRSLSGNNFCSFICFFRRTLADLVMRSIETELRKCLQCGPTGSGPEIATIVTLLGICLPPSVPMRRPAYLGCRRPRRVVASGLQCHRKKATTISRGFFNLHDES